MSPYLPLQGILVLIALTSTIWVIREIFEAHTKKQYFLIGPTFLVLIVPLACTAFFCLIPISAKEQKVENYSIDSSAYFIGLVVDDKLIWSSTDEKEILVSNHSTPVITKLVETTPLGKTYERYLVEWKISKE